MSLTEFYHDSGTVAMISQHNKKNGGGGVLGDHRGASGREGDLPRCRASSDARILVTCSSINGARVPEGGRREREREKKEIKGMFDT
ncbi:hypothetical protein TIFTF001_002458 [Ficus carica]|uniref:Uncharacterized protein n=1 Tax=Ficus carica TaxID=3494 RepID=A0AA87Z651_FICCA|nr:hypothetical protein TIFTF001_002458 [Ficus carica]